MLRAAIVQGLRSLHRRPTSSVISVLCLALGMSLTTMSWALIDDVLRHPYGLSDVDRLAVFWESDRAAGRELIELSLPDVQDWQARAHSFESLAAMGSSHWSGLAKIAGETVPIAPRAVSQSFFSTLGVNPSLGRAFESSDLVRSNPPPLILSHALWRERFGSSPSVVGTQLFVDGIDHRVVGVMPPSFAFPESPDAWISVERSLAQAFETNKLNETAQRQLGVLLAVGRMQRAVPIDRARSELQDITVQIRRDLGPPPAGWTVTGTPFSDALLGGVGQRTWIAFWMSLGVFAFACANVAAVRLALGAERQAELLARLSLGASRARIFVELAAEAIPLIVFALLGAVAATWTLSAALAAVPALSESGLISGVTVITIASPLSLLCIVAWLAIGPATASILALKLDLSRLTSARPTVTTHRRTGATIVAAQVAVAIVTVALAATAIQTFERMSRIDVGFSLSGVSVADLALPGTAADARANEDRLRRGLESMPGVLAVGGASLRPFRFGEIGDGLPVRKSGDSAVDLDHSIAVNRVVVSGSYFAALGLPMVQGGDFSPFDRAGGEPVVIVSRSVARALWGDEQAVGRRVETYTLSEKWRSRLVVGVVGDARYRSLVRPPLELYMPAAQSAGVVSSYVIRTRDGSSVSDAEVRTAVRQVSSDIGVEAVLPTSEILRGVLGPSAFVARMLSLLGIAGLVLLALGVFGAVAVQLRAATREIGVRQSLGATPMRASSRPLRLLGVGTSSGVVVGVLLTPLVLDAASRFGLGTDSSAALQTSIAVVVVFASAVMASWPSVRRVSRTSPAILLRQE